MHCLTPPPPGYNYCTLERGHEGPCAMPLRSTFRCSVCDSKPCNCVKIEGIGKDAPTVTNAHGGKQSALSYRCDLFPPLAMLHVSKVLEHGATKYGVNNWHAIPVDENLNHALVHCMSFLAGDTQDDHLGHMACRVMFALEQLLSGRDAKLKDTQCKGN